jgi:hypothetical protein
MPARLLKNTIALLTLLIDLRYTLSRLLAHPLTSSFLPAFQALRTKWTEVHTQEITLHEALSDARAQVDIADTALDDFAARFSNAVLALTGQKRDAPLYVHFFPKPLSEFRKPILAGQLRDMKNWLLSLATTPHSTLAAMKTELETLVTAGEKATQARDTIVLKIRDFRDVGERAQLITKINAERKDLHGALSKLALSTPGLPSNFQNQFFKLADSDDEAEETVESLDAEIKELEERLAERNKLLVELKQEAADEAKEAQEKAQKALKLAELNKDIEAKQKEAKALKDELE